MIHNGYLVHPDIWMLWTGILLSPVNTCFDRLVAGTEKRRAMRVYVVSHGGPYEGNEVDSVWLSYEHAEAREKWLRAEHGTYHCYWLEEFDTGVVRKPEESKEVRKPDAR